MADLDNASKWNIAEECVKLHRGEPVDFWFPPHTDANTVKETERSLREIYEQLYDGDLRIAHMQRDSEDRVLHMTFVKQEGE